MSTSREGVGVASLRLQYMVQHIIAIAAADGRHGSVPFLPTVQTIASLIEPGLRANQNCTFKALFLPSRGLSASSFLDIIA